MTNFLRYFKIFLILLCFSLVCYMCYDYYNLKTNINETVKEIKIIEEHIKHDTIFVQQPVYKEKHIIRHDTIYQRDTVVVTIQIEQKVYEDSLYTAWISGYEPSLDSIEIYNKTVYKTITNEKIITKNQKNKHWGVGFQVGTTYNGKFAPYLGIGLSYNFLTF